MVTFFCPGCWHPVTQEAETCPHCGVNIPSILIQRDYAAKLIAALSHPEPATPIRTAWILGQRRERAAVVPLLEVLKGEADYFIKAAVIEALGEIGDPSSRAILMELTQGDSSLLRARAAEALERFDRQAK